MIATPAGVTAPCAPTPIPNCAKACQTRLQSVGVGPFATEGWYLPYRFLLPLVTLGLLWPAARRAEDPVASGVLAVVLASQVALALATVAWARYRFPIEPLLWPYAAGSIVELVRRGGRGRLVLAGIVLMNGALLAWQMR